LKRTSLILLRKKQLLSLDYLSEKSIAAFIDTALAEDVGDGDHSSMASIPANAQGKAKLLIKGEGILAGVELARKIAQRVDPNLVTEVFIQDGTPVRYGDIGLHLHGNVQSILKAERLILNCMQRMSGIATHTDALTKLIQHTRARLLDTRKTTPNFRLPEKWAVKIGGGENHRFGLYDMIILKDNHVDYAGSIRQAILATNEYLKKTGKNLRIEIETRNLQEVQQALDTGHIHRIMLDNMSIDMLKEAVALIGDRYETEASGGVTAETIKNIAETGVNFISVGALTHSVASMDISLKAF
jgi:nicotinate-nucleotide pyrophosphorylase (carboxylating)